MPIPWSRFLGALYFEPWSETIKKIKDLKEIFNKELEILSCELNKQGLIEITCNCPIKDAPYSGGVLFISAQGFEVWDEERNEIGIARLQEVCKQYWDNWENKNKHSA